MIVYKFRLFLALITFPIFVTKYMVKFLNLFKPRKAYSLTDALKNLGEDDYVYHQEIKSGDNAGSYTAIPVVGAGMDGLVGMAIKEEYERLVSKGKTVIYLDL